MVKNIITTENSKLGGSIAQVNMPYVMSCRSDVADICMPECYCTHGNMRFETVRQAHINRYNIYKENPIGFFEQISKELTHIPYKYFRWHAAGDIPDGQYLILMCKLARKHKDTMFLAFTKQFEIVNEYLDSHHKPSNFVLCLSNWKNFVPDNPHNLPTSHVDFGDGNVPKFAYECPGSCAECPGTHCWHMHKGDAVSFHKH